MHSACHDLIVRPKVEGRRSPRISTAPVLNRPLRRLGLRMLARRSYMDDRRTRSRCVMWRYLGVLSIAEIDRTGKVFDNE